MSHKQSHNLCLWCQFLRLLLWRVWIGPFPLLCESLLCFSFPLFMNFWVDASLFLWWMQLLRTFSSEHLLVTVHEHLCGSYPPEGEGPGWQGITRHVSVCLLRGHPHSDTHRRGVSGLASSLALGLTWLFSSSHSGGSQVASAFGWMLCFPDNWWDWSLFLHALAI